MPRIKPPPLRRKSLMVWTKSLLREIGIRPRRKYSQNFIVDPTVIRDFIARLQLDKPFIEIGCGLGTLSYYLSLSVKKNNLLFEIDGRLASIAAEIVVPPSMVIVSDALEHEWIYEQVVSNAPYHITSDILVKLSRTNNVKRAILVLQEDVVNRITADPGTPTYGRLTVLIKTLFKTSKGPVYPPSSFYPSPEVSSQMIVLERIRKYDKDMEMLEEITRILFSKRRKKAMKVISRDLGVNLDSCRDVSIAPDLRVYELDPGVLLRLVECLKKSD